MLYHLFGKDYILSRIGIRLSVYAVCLSLFFASISIATAVYFQMKEVKKDLIEEAYQAISTVEMQLAKYVWDIDDHGIEVTVDGLANVASIRGVKIEGNSINSRQAGSLGEKPDITHHVTFNDEYMATLYVSYDLQKINKNLLDKFKFTAFFILFIITLIGFTFYFIVNRSIIRHIAHISESKMTFSAEDAHEYSPIKLPRKGCNDEISDLVDALNEGRKSTVELLKAKKEQQDQIEFQANFDLLTGLPNRRNLYHYLERQIKHYQENQGQLVIMFVDLDGFKQVNDSMGHSIGDKVLCECADRLKRISEKLCGYIGRLGGDEFIICYYSEYVNTYKSACRDIINVFNEKIHTQGVHVKLGCSIGVTFHPEHLAEDAKQIISNADNALYRAKSAGKSTFFCFNEVIQKELQFEKQIEDKLSHAIENNVFQIYYQPLINIQTNSIVGFEALIRWNDPELGFVRPDKFIAVAEKMGVIFDIDQWVFKKSIEQVKHWHKVYDQPFILSVNFSPSNFYHGHFSNWLSKPKFSENNLNWVELEVTERLVLNDDPIVLEGIQQLKSKGIKFSIDDFGMGYSSLGYIKKFSHVLSKIKIDRMFINEIMTTDFDIAFVQSIMMLSDSLGLSVLAEGAEEKGQVDLLRDVGCKYVQGYYFSRPLPAQEVEEFVEQWLIENNAAINHCLIPTDHHHPSKPIS